MPESTPMATSPQRTPRMAPPLRREQLLDAALEVLTEHGFGAVTVEAVARRAGVTRPVIYDAFGDLERLILALIDRAERTALGPLLQIVTTDPGDDVDPERFLNDSVLAFLQAVKADPRTWRLILMPPRGSSSELRARIRRSRRLIADHVTTLLDWGVPRRGGPLGLDHPLSARVIVAAAEDAARLMLAHPRRYTPERLTALTRDLLLLLPPGPPPADPAAPPPALTAPFTPPAETPPSTPPAETPPSTPSSETPPPPPIQKHRLPQAERREQLLDVALALLAEEGFGALSMEAIARRAQVNRAVLYRSFANLHVLLAALLHREDKRVRRTLDGLLPTEPGTCTPAELVGEALGKFLRAVVERPQTWRVALLRPESTPPALQKVVNRRRSALARRLEPLVRWGVERVHPQPATLDVGTLARMLLSVCEEEGRLLLDDSDYPLERLMAGSWALLASLPTGSNR
jgi:AcrR family transcriptional regulator